MSGLDRLVDQGVVDAGAKLGSLTTYRFGGPARYLAQPADRDELHEVIAARTDEPVLVLGRGSNLVISDSGFDGLVIRLVGEFERVTVDGDLVEAGGAAELGELELGVKQLSLHADQVAAERIALGGVAVAKGAVDNGVAFGPPVLENSGGQRQYHASHVGLALGEVHLLPGQAMAVRRFGSNGLGVAGHEDPYREGRAAQRPMMSMHERCPPVRPIGDQPHALPPAFQVCAAFSLRIKSASVPTV